MKNKVPWLLVYLIISTVLAVSLGMAVTGDLLSLTSPDPGGSVNAFTAFDYIWDLMGVFWQIMTFQVLSVPPLVVVILYYVPILTVVMYIISVLRGTD
ncbi:MAG: hypothetical protein PHS68_05760 [Candidatus Izemoplasmatales bacterium]|nr:hypothetical protein [Candidatus Izemoplasmatales bacterium]